MSDLDSLVDGGWTAHRKHPPFPTYTFYKCFQLRGEDVDALVFIYRHEAGYEVRSRVGAATFDAGEGHRETIEESLALARGVCGRIEAEYG